MALSGLPVLTVKDSLLEPGGVIRDPVGMLGIWRSGLGRALVPYLASSVTRLEGIVAVLLIQYVFEELSKDQKKLDRIACFRMLEGIVEYCLKTQLKVKPLYGGRPLAGEFVASVRDTRTVANGLRQYYQGTCIRAGLVRRDTRKLSEEARSWCETPQEDIKLLVQTMRVLVEAGECRMPEVEKDHPGFLQQLSCFLTRASWARHLQKPLLGTDECFAFARLCSEHHLQAENLKASLRALSLATSGDVHGPAIAPVVAQIECCEPFLCWCHGILEWLRQNDREQMAHCLNELAGFLPDIAAAAELFRRISDAHRTHRYRQMLKVALAASAGADTFLQELLTYHRRVMSERGAEPLVGLEGDGTLSVAVRSTGDTRLLALKGRIERGAWMNDYYLTAAGNIFLATAGRASDA